MNLLRGLWLIFRSPHRFASLAAEDAKHLTKPTEPQFERNAQEIRRAIAASLELVLASVFVGWLSGLLLARCLGPANPIVNRVLQYTGVGVLLWATLAKQGWNLQTWNGNTLPERIDRTVYRVMYVVGSWLLVLSVAWRSQQ